MPETSITAKSAFEKKIQSIWLKKIATDLYWILAVCGLCRMIYYSNVYNTQDNDSPSYLNYRGNLLDGRIDVFRTPCYPYFIKFIRYFGEEHLIGNIITFQCLISFLTIPCFFSISRYLFSSRTAVAFSTLIFGLALPVINFDKVIRTESLSVSLIVFFMGVIVLYMKAPGKGKALFISFYLFILVMLRPSFIALLPVLFILWIVRYRMYRNERWPCICGLLMSGIIVLLLAGYSSLNNRQNGYYGISTVTNINQLDIIINAGIYEAGNDTELAGLIKSQLGVPEPRGKHWNLLRKINDEYNANRISAYIISCVRAEPGKYVKNIFRTELSIEHQNIFTRYGKYKNSSIRTVLIRIESLIFYIPFNLVFTFLVFIFFAIFRKFSIEKEKSFLLMTLWLMVVSQVAVAIIGAQDEYQRLVVTTIPELIVMFSLCLDNFLFLLEKLSAKRNILV